jgi:AraC family transcriptional regulator
VSPLHAHERACFHYLFQGGYVERQGARSQDCDPLTLSFQPSDHEHSYCGYDAAARVLTIEIEPIWLTRLREYGVNLDQVINFRSALVQWLVTRLYREFLVRETDSALVIEGLALELAVEISRRRRLPLDRRPPPWLNRAKDFLHEHFMDSLSLPEVARIAEVHPVHLARTFRQHLHCTVGEYIRQLRIEFACRQLAESRATLLEIALASGFSDQSQFSRAFKLVMGLTPGEFRAASQTR